ncbi:Ankyrin repeat-containing protein [Aphelenchoides fujianensis]|nr:Ankyrin repeat-containing protein [Aphelenchoides fujianensis]
MVYRNRRARASSAGGDHGNDEQPSLPDRLAKALKLLRPAHGSNGESGHRSNAKTAVVDADDVVYFPNVRDRSAISAQRSQPQIAPNCHDFHSVNRGDAPPKGVHHHSSSERHIPVQLPHGFSVHQPRLPHRNSHVDGDRVHPLKTLDDLRQLYKSVPNFGAFDGDEEDPRQHSNSNNRNGRTADSTHNTSRSADHPRVQMTVAQSSADQGSPFSELSPRSINEKGAHRKCELLVVLGVHHVDSIGCRQRLPIAQTPVRVPPPAPPVSPPAFTVGTNMRSLVVVNPADELFDAPSTTKGAHPPTVVHVARADCSPTADQSCWANPSTTRPERFATSFTFNVRDLRSVIEQPTSQTRLGNAAYAQLLDRLRATLELFGHEIQRFVGPFGKCAVWDVNTALKSFLNEKISSSCIEFASNALSAYNSSASLTVGMEQRAGLRLNVGKMWRWFRFDGVQGLVFDSIAVYVSGIFEKLLLLYVQAAERSRGSKTFAEQIRPHRTLFDGFARFDELEGLREGSLEKLLDVSVQNPEIDRAPWRRRWIEMHRFGLRADDGAMDALFHYVRCPQTKECGCSARKPNFGDWMTTVVNLVEHRNSPCISASDVLEAARILLRVDIPPRSAADFVDSVDCVEWRVLDLPHLWESNEPADLRKVFATYDFNSANAHGLTCLSRCLLLHHTCASASLIERGFGVDTPILPSTLHGLQRNCRMFDEAIVTNNVEVVRRLLKRRVALNASWMHRETPLQLAAAVGEPTVVRLLLDNGADLLFTSVVYDRNGVESKSNGTPSALALSAALGHSSAFELLLAEFRLMATNTGGDLPPSIADLLANDTRLKAGNKFEACSQTADFAVLPPAAQTSLREALYFSLVFGNLPAAHELTAFGVRWNAQMWRACLEWSLEQKSGLGVRLFVNGFAVSELHEASVEAMEAFCKTLFELIEQTLVQSPFLDDRTFGDVLSIVSRIFRYGRVPDPVLQSNAEDLNSGTKSTGVIDAKYCDSEKFSDVRFVVEGRTIHAHRIALANASPQFESNLQTAGDVVHVEDVDYAVFKAIIEFVYGKHADCMQRISTQPITNQMRAVDVAKQYGLEELSERIVGLIDEQITLDSCLSIYSYACKTKSERLLAAVQPFVLAISTHFFATRNEPMGRRSGRRGPRSCS